MSGVAEVQQGTAACGDHARSSAPRENARISIQTPFSVIYSHATGDHRFSSMKGSRVREMSHATWGESMKHM